MLRPFWLARTLFLRHRIQCRCASGGPGSSADFYSLLGVRKDATQREIKAAYYQLSKRYHPDVAGSNSSAASKFIQISEAYECLRDPDRRRAYDNQRSGQAGRYPGDNFDPFREFSQRSRHSNPFHSRQYTQQEYQRIWEEFNRLRNERSQYDQKMEWERQRMWNEAARKRAERWQSFHQRYPNGPPGSFRWEWKFGNTSANDKGINQGWELFRKLMMVYFVCFFVISLVRVSLQEMGNTVDQNNKKKQIVVTEPNRDKFAFMNEAPVQNAPGLRYPDTVPQYPKGSTVPPSGERYLREGDTEFSMYAPPKSM